MGDTFADLEGLLCVEVGVTTTKKKKVLIERRGGEVGCSGLAKGGGSRCAFVVGRKIRWVKQK